MNDKLLNIFENLLLIEHVDRPNADVPDRPYLFCPNECFDGKAFWDFYGYFYYEGKCSDLETGKNYGAIKGDNDE